MEKRMSAWETRRQFGQVLKDVSRDRTKVVIESHGEPVAVVIPIQDYEKERRHRIAFYDQLRQISERIDLSESEANQLVESAMKETGRLSE